MHTSECGHQGRRSGELGRVPAKVHGKEPGSAAIRRAVDQPVLGREAS